MTDSDTTGQRLDEAAESTQDDSVRTDVHSSSPDPGQPHDAPGDRADVPATEGNRQLAETVRSIERLEESN